MGNLGYACEMDDLWWRSVNFDALTPVFSVHLWLWLLFDEMGVVKNTKTGVEAGYGYILKIEIKCGILRIVGADKA